MTFKRNNLSQDVIHALTLTLVLCLTLLSGCSDKEEILPPEPEEGTDIVSEYKAYVGHPFNASLGEQTNGYTIKNNDPEKLKTEYFGIEHFGVVCIFPLCEGESSIHVLDKNNKLVKIIKIQKEIEDRERGRKSDISLSGSMFFCISGRICRFDCRRRRTDLTSGIYDCGTAGTYCNCNK